MLTSAMFGLTRTSQEPKPAPYVISMKESAEFYSNRVIKEHKDDADKSHVEWTRSFVALLTTLAAYVKEHHTTGLAWNPRVSGIQKEAISLDIWELIEGGELTPFCFGDREATQRALSVLPTRQMFQLHRLPRLEARLRLHHLLPRDCRPRLQRRLAAWTQCSVSSIRERVSPVGSRRWTGAK